jgi:phenylacetate-CoA ligase
MPRERLAALQLERLRAAVDLVLRRQPPGAQRLKAAGIRAGDDLRTLDDLAAVPLLSKKDLREHYPFGLLAADRSELVRVHASSGTGGKPTVVAYTRQDLETWTELMARCLTLAGVRPGMVMHNAYGYGLFTGGLGFHQGAERAGVTVIPVSGGFTARQAMLLRDLGADVLASTPSYALAIAQALGEHKGTTRLRLGLFGAEPMTEQMRAEIERELPGLRAVTFYGLSEMFGPGVAAECLQARNGLHVHEDCFLTEVVDPATGRAVPPGTEGELVFTTLSSQALPLLRYRTGDIGRLDVTPCVCGRTTARLAGLRGRRDDMLIIRGVNVHPSVVEHVLLSAGGVAPHYRIFADRPGALDELTVECEPASGSASSAGSAGSAGLRARLEQLLREQTGLRVNVVIAPAGSIPRSEGKAVRVIDRR